MPHSDVLIIGGGVIGLTTAWFLAKLGVRVTVLDKGDLGAESSWAGAGIIPPGNPEHTSSGYETLRAISSRMYPAISAELRESTGIDNGYRICGGIEFFQTPEEERESIKAWHAERIAFEYLSSTRILDLEPALNSTLSGGYYLPDMAQVRNPWHVRALIEACRSRGVVSRTHAPIVGLNRSGDSIAAVQLESGERLSAGRYLLAAGAWSDELLRPLGVETGIHPVRGQIVLLKTQMPIVERVVLEGKDYLVPRRDGHVLVGSTEEPEAGFEKRTTADAIIKLMAFAQHLVPGLAKAERVKAWAGLRPGSIDGRPSLGAIAGIRNLYLAGGHFRAGIQLSVGTAMVMSELLTGRKTSMPLDDFRPGRDASIADSYRVSIVVVRWR